MIKYCARIKNGENPCYQCQDRTMTCHDTCERYLEAKKNAFERTKWLSKKNGRYATVEQYEKRVRIAKFNPWK